MNESRTYWLSFCDAERPKGQQFLGACIVQVTEKDAAAALAKRPDMFDKVEGPWIGAAVSAAWQAGCNPGGEVASIQIDGEHVEKMLRYYTLGTLMAKAEIEAIDEQIEASGAEREP